MNTINRILNLFKDLGWTVYCENNLPKYLTLTRNENGRIHAINVAPGIKEDFPEITSYEEGTGRALAIDYATNLNILAWAFMKYDHNKLIGVRE